MVSSFQQNLSRMRGRSIRQNLTAAVAGCLLSVALVSTAFGQEVAVPDKPVQVAVTSYRIVALTQTFEPEARFSITYADSTGRTYTDEHSGPSQVADPAGGGEPIANPSGAEAFLRQMNTGDFTSTSIVKRLLQHLVQHGKIPPSTVAGRPESVQEVKR